MAPWPLPPQGPSGSVLLLGSAVLRNALGSQFSKHIIQVVGIWVAVASEIRAKLCLVMDLIPDDGIGLARGAGRTDGKDETAIPGHKQQLQDLREEAGDQGQAFSGGQRLSLGKWRVLPRVLAPPAS